MRVSILFVFCCFTGLHLLEAQTQMFQRLEFPVVQNGKTLEHAFAGGLNVPQFSEADLNNDQVQDLVIFDRAGDVFLTFLNEGVPGAISYRFAPEFACNFPPLVDYVLLRDYNRDGAPDIFCSSLPIGTQEVQVYQGYFENNMLKFKPVLFTYPGCTVCDPSFIYYPSTIPGFWTNLYIADTDIPAVDDIDGDGDLDILTFDGSAGGHVWLAKNMSVEMGFGFDSLIYRITDRCWGRFYESGLTLCSNCLSPAPDTCVSCFRGPLIVEDREERHPGSTLMTYDQDGDGDKEIVLGDISFSCLNMMTNGGTPQVAWMNAQDDNFPSYDTPADIFIFPAAFYLDMNNDGKKDMVVAPNSKFSNEDRQGVWFYQNTATEGHHFTLETKRLFAGDMIDLGSAAHPALVDVDADGLLDLVVGNYGYYTPGNAQNASLYLYRNTGAATGPQFTLEDTDWLGLSVFTPNDFDFYPAFGDLDNDGDTDMLVGSNFGAVYYFRNTAGPGKPMQMQRDFNIMWATLDVSSYSTPAIVDLDNDGLMDIVMGERSGNLNFLRNVGAPDNPIFNPTPTFSKLGAVDTRVPPFDVGFSAPVFITQPNGALLLVTGTQDGHLEAYTDITASESPYTIVSERWGNVDDGNRSSPTFGDLDGDGILEMITGNLRGGLSLYKTQLVDCTTSTNAAAASQLPRPRLSPNPARHWVRVEWPSDLPVQWQAFDLPGRLIARGEASGGTFTIPVNNWETGAYFIEFRGENQLFGRNVLTVAR